MLTPDSSVTEGPDWHLTTLRNGNGMVATFMDRGATWLSARVPMGDGSVREALLGCASPADYAHQSAYLGATVGRYANRIANAQLHSSGTTIPLLANQGKHQLHGGPDGFHQRRWQLISQSDSEVEYRLESADGDQGFPGTLRVSLRYRLDDDNSLSIIYHAVVDKPCPVNLTNHAYFNLDGIQGDARQHRLMINADRYLPVDSEGIPDAALTAVDGTSFDFRRAKEVARDFLQDDDQRKVQGFDHAFLLNTDGAKAAATLWSADSKLKLDVFTHAPALQLYTGNHLAGTPARDGGGYSAYQGIALESECLPDSPNHPEWPQPDCWLQPGESYQSVTRYKLTALD